MHSTSDAINGWKRVGDGYTGFSATQSQCKMSKVEIQTRSFMAWHQPCTQALHIRF